MKEGDRVGEQEQEKRVEVRAELFQRTEEMRQKENERRAKRGRGTNRGGEKKEGITRQEE